MIDYGPAKVKKKKCLKNWEWFMSSLTFVRFQIKWECDASCVIVILGSQSGGNHLSLLSAVFTWLFHYVTPRTCRDPVNSIHSDTSRSCFSPTSFSFLPSIIKSMLYYSMLLLDLRLLANCFDHTRTDLILKFQDLGFFCWLY